MKGIVHGLSKNRHRIAALTDYGYVVFYIEDGEAFIGDIITGNLDDHGDQVLTNQTIAQTISVYIEAIHASKECAESLLRNR